MKRNYQKELDSLINGLAENETHSLLIHSCCAPCSSYCLEYLSNYFKIAIYYYNPNIYPESEYQKRMEEQKRLVKQLPAQLPITFLEGIYEPDKFNKVTQGLNCTEGGERCFQCYELRLKETAKLASEGNFDYFTTTLSVSPHKDAKKLVEIGEDMEKEYHATFLPVDFKKKNGYKRSIELSNEYQLYRQNYCGCVHSKIEADRRRDER